MSTPIRSSASVLLSAAQIWSTDDPFSSDSVAVEAAASDAVSAAKAEVPIAETTSVSVATASTPSAPSDSATAVMEMMIAATAATDSKQPDTPERSLAETIASANLPPPPRIWPPRKLSLALQGGGTLSAFTWGVLDRLLEEPACDFDTISGASAGAINAVLLASGLANGGRDEARGRLAEFWTGLMDDASFRSLMLIGGYSPASSAVSFGTGLRSGRADPLELDPLRDALSATIDFAAVQSPGAPRLLIAAARIRDGQPQVFRNGEITPDVLLASTCPAPLHAAVDIGNESYWDGSYASNPPLIQIAHESSAADLLVVQVTPARDGYVPVTSAAIDRRLDQIAANAVLNAELAALEWARSDGLHPPRVHRLAAEDEIESLAQRDATDLGSDFIAMLHQRGREAADRWLREAPIGTTLATPDAQPAATPEDALAVTPA